MDPSLESIWNDMSAQLRRFILSRVEDEAAADDLLQEVFLRIHTHIRGLQNSERIESWIYQIARNAIIDHYRTRRKVEPLNEAVPGDIDVAVEPEPDAAQEIAQSMRRMVETLPEPYREALLLTEFEGLSQKDLAERLGISLSGAKSRVQRAREKIKDDLLACCHFEFDRYGRIVDFWAHCCSCSEPQNKC